MIYIRYLVSLICCILIFCACVHTNRENTRQNVNQGQSASVRSNVTTNAGWEFIKSRMHAPSSARLISYRYGDEVMRMIQQYSPISNARLLDCITVGFFEYDAQNPFGAMIRDRVFVFFNNGNPCWIETVRGLDETISTLTRVGIPENFIPTLNATLKFNGCGC